MEIGDNLFLTSPKYPELYPSDTVCTWFFTANDSGSYVIKYIDMVITIWDALYIGITHTVSQENIISQLYRGNAPNTISVGHELMWIRFYSNGDFYSHRGFFILVERLPFPGMVKFQMS